MALLDLIFNKPKVEGSKVKQLTVAEAKDLLYRPYILFDGVEQPIAHWDSNVRRFLHSLAKLNLHDWVSSNVAENYFGLNSQQIVKVMEAFEDAGIIKLGENQRYLLTTEIKLDIAKRSHISCYNLHEFFDNGAYYHAPIDTADDFVVPNEDRVGIAFDVNGLARYYPHGTSYTFFLYHPKLGWSNVSIDTVSRNSHPDKYTHYGNKEGDIEYTQAWNARRDNSPKNPSHTEFDCPTTSGEYHIVLSYLSSLDVGTKFTFADIVKATGIDVELPTILVDLVGNGVVRSDCNSNDYTLLANVTSSSIGFPLLASESDNRKTMPRSVIVNPIVDGSSVEGEKDQDYVIALDHALDYIQTLVVDQFVDFEQLSDWYSINSPTLAKVVQTLTMLDIVERDIVNGYYHLLIQVVDDRVQECMAGKPFRSPLAKYNLHQLFDAMGTLGVHFHSPIKDEADLLHPPKDNVMGIAPDVAKLNPLEKTVHPTYFLYTPELGWSYCSVEIMHSNLHPTSYTAYGNNDGHEEYLAHYNLKQERINFIAIRLHVERQVAHQIVSRDISGEVFTKLFQQFRTPEDRDNLKYHSGQEFDSDNVTSTKQHFRKLVTLYQEETDCRLSEVANRLGLTLDEIRELIA